MTDGAHTLEDRAGQRYPHRLRKNQLVTVPEDVATNTFKIDKVLAVDSTGSVPLYTVQRKTADGTPEVVRTYAQQVSNQDLLHRQGREVDPRLTRGKKAMLDRWIAEAKQKAELARSEESLLKNQVQLISSAPTTTANQDGVTPTVDRLNIARFMTGRSKRGRPKVRR